MIKYLLFILTFFSLSCSGQKKDIGLSVSTWAPDGWFTADKKLMRRNLSNYKFSREELNKLGNDIKGSKVLGIYYKYDPKTHYGLVPTISFYLRKNDSKDIDEFSIYIEKEIEKAKSVVSDFKYIDAPKIIMVGERKAFYACSTYNLKVKTGEIASVRTKFVCIPLDKTYLYVTLIDNTTEDCSALYKEVVDKIKIE